MCENANIVVLAMAGSIAVEVLELSFDFSRCWKGFLYVDDERRRGTTSSVVSPIVLQSTVKLTWQVNNNFIRNEN